MARRLAGDEGFALEVVPERTAAASADHGRQVSMSCTQLQ
jgi:hypothetical protein